MLAVLANTFLARNSDHLQPIFRDSLVCLFLFFCFYFTKRPANKPFFEINFSKKEGYLIGGILLLVIAVSIRATFSVWSHATQYHDCTAVGSLLHRMECVLFASSIGNSSIRIALPHVFAFVVAIASFGITKNLGNRTKCLFFLCISTVVIFGIEEFLSSASATRSFHQNLFGIPLEEGSQLMSGPFTNYGWTWPYIVPVAAISMWIFATDNTFKTRATSFVLSAICGWIILTNSQRGGVLTFTICAFVSSIWFLANAMLKQNNTIKGYVRYLSIFIFVIVALFIVLLFFTEDMNSINSVTSQFGLTIRKSPFTTSDARLGLWQYGFEMWKQNPLFGNGHGSWLWMSLENTGKLRKTVIFDSAHNLYVQLFAELGLIHTLCILVGFVFIGLRVFGNLKTEKNGVLLFLLLLISFVVATSVQEIDYIRATYYQWAAVLGITSANLSSKSSRTILIKSRPLFILFLLFYSAIFALYSVFSSGVYAFEPRERDHNWPTWGRWVSENAVLSATPGKYGPTGYTAYPILMTYITDSENAFSEDSKKILQGTKRSDYLFASLAGNFMRITKKSIQFTGKHAIDSRSVSGRIGYPTFQTKANLIWARNIDLTMNEGEMELQCKTSSCYVLFGDCRIDGEKPSITLFGSRVTINSKVADFPVEINVAIKEDGTTEPIDEVDARNTEIHWSPQNFENSKPLLLTITSLENTPTKISNLSCK